MARKFPYLIASAALSTCLAGAAFAACRVTGEEMDIMMTAGGEAPCFAATPAAGIAPAGGAATPSGDLLFEREPRDAATAPPLTGAAATPGGTNTTTFASAPFNFE